MRAGDGTDMPLIDGETFEWVAKLTSNRRAVFVASGLATQLLPPLFRGSRDHEGTKTDGAHGGDGGID